MAKTTASARGTNRKRATPLQKEHRHEDDADAQGRDQRRHGDLARAFENGLVEIGSHVQVALDIFDRHGGVVDQNADRQRETAQRHDVDGLARENRAPSTT